MAAHKELQEILERTVGWEKKLNDLYDVAHIGVKNEESRKVIDFLQERQLSNLEILENLNVNTFGPTEWIRFSHDYRDEEIVPNRQITRESTPGEIFDTILDYEEKLKKFYELIVDQIRTEKQKELFSSLVRFREEQISRIRNFMGARG